MEISDTSYHAGDADAPGVILIVLDGCRPDGLQQARVPNLGWMMQNGAYTLKARTIFPPITFPCHMSMLFGVKPLRHGIYGNYYIDVDRDCHHSIFDLAHICGRKVASFYDWERLRDLASPSVMEFVYYRRCRIEAEASLAIVRVCADYIRQERPDLCFINLGSIDKVGHETGWMSRKYIDQIETIDSAVGLLVEELRRARLVARYHFMVLSDHGGIAKDHGTETADEMTIPWMVLGCGIKKGYEIKEDVYIYDTAPTIARLLRLPVRVSGHGKVVQEIFDENVRSLL